MSELLTEITNSVTNYWTLYGPSIIAIITNIASIVLMFLKVKKSDSITFKSEDGSKLAKSINSKLSTLEATINAQNLEIEDLKNEIKRKDIKKKTR